MFPVDYDLTKIINRVEQIVGKSFTQKYRFYMTGRNSKYNFRQKQGFVKNFRCLHGKLSYLKLQTAANKNLPASTKNTNK